jgi:SAM-dependent methyltransferase
MTRDEHLGTGSYDPEKYWSARALHSEGDPLKGVCVFKATQDENRSADRVQRYLMRAALKHITLRGKDVLEYGCGVGRWVDFFQGYGLSWRGVDISDEMLAIATKRARGVELKKIQEGRIPYPEGSFDLVYSVTVVHHNPHEQQEKIVSEMARVLRNDGYLILYEDLGGRQHFNLFPRSVSAWTSLAQRHGFVPVWQRGVRYWLLRDLSFALWRRLRRAASPGASPVSTQNSLPNGNSLWRKLVGYLDLVVDPYLFRLVPCKYQTSAVMVFRRRG